MRHVELFLYILLISTGFGGIMATGLLWSRLRERIVLVITIVIAFFSLGLLFLLVLHYLREIIIYPVDLEPFATAANLVITIFMYAGLGVCLRLLKPAGSLLPFYLLLVLVVAAYLVFGILPSRYPGLEEWTSAHQVLVSLVSVVAPSALLAYSGFVIRLRSAAIDDSSVRFLLRWLGLILIVFAGAATVATVLTNILGWDNNPTGLLNYFLYLGWNLTAVASFIKYLAHPADILDFGKVPTGALKRYSLSKRESEVIEQISLGLSNKEVAANLNISFTTVRTHVYNIFKKTGAASRVDLLRILSSK